MTQTVLLKLAEMTRTARIPILLILQTIPVLKRRGRLLLLRIQIENLRTVAEGSRSQIGLMRPQVSSQKVRQLELLMLLVVLMMHRKARLMMNRTLKLTTAAALLHLWVWMIQRLMTPRV